MRKEGKWCVVLSHTGLCRSALITESAFYKLLLKNVLWYCWTEGLNCSNETKSKIRADLDRKGWRAEAWAEDSHPGILIFRRKPLVQCYRDSVHIAIRKVLDFSQNRGAPFSSECSNMDFKKIDTCSSHYVHIPLFLWDDVTRLWEFSRGLQSVDGAEDQEVLSKFITRYPGCHESWLWKWLLRQLILLQSVSLSDFFCWNESFCK